MSIREIGPLFIMTIFERISKVFLLSREAAIGSLQKEIEKPIIIQSPQKE